jgi:MOSC domain-containing protein YiiM
VLAIAMRSPDHGPMVELWEADIVEQGGIKGDKRARPARGVTLLALPQWRDVCRDIAVDLPWHTRRANLLIDTPTLAHTITQVVAIGEVRIKIIAETKPCDRMDEIRMGLQAALKPDCRGGVYGLVLRGGHIAVTDEARLEA